MVLTPGQICSMYIKDELVKGMTSAKRGYYVPDEATLNEIVEKLNKRLFANFKILLLADTSLPLEDILFDVFSKNGGISLYEKCQKAALEIRRKG